MSDITTSSNTALKPSGFAMSSILAALTNGLGNSGVTSSMFASLLSQNETVATKAASTTPSVTSTNLVVGNNGAVDSASWHSLVNQVRDFLQSHTKQSNAQSNGNSSNNQSSGSQPSVKVSGGTQATGNTSSSSGVNSSSACAPTVTDSTATSASPLTVTSAASTATSTSDSQP